MDDYEKFMKEFNEAYKQYPTGLVVTNPSPEAIRQQAEYDRYAENKTNGKGGGNG